MQKISQIFLRGYEKKRFSFSVESRFPSSVGRGRNGGKIGGRYIAIPVIRARYFARTYPRWDRYTYIGWVLLIRLVYHTDSRGVCGLVASWRELLVASRIATVCRPASRLKGLVVIPVESRIRRRRGDTQFEAEVEVEAEEEADSANPASSLLSPSLVPLCSPSGPLVGIRPGLLFISPFMVDAKRRP